MGPYEKSMQYPAYYHHMIDVIGEQRSFAPEMARKLNQQKKRQQQNEMSFIESKQVMKYVQLYRRTMSYPEEMLRDSFKKLTVDHDGDNSKSPEDNEHYTSAHRYKRLKSCGQFQSALVTLAIREGDVIQLWRLLARKDVDINNVDGLGMQPIHYACIYGELEVLKILLQHDVDVNSPTEGGETALDLAVREGNFDLAQYLVNKGAKVFGIMNGIRGKVNSKPQAFRYSARTSTQQESTYRKRSLEI